MLTSMVINKLMCSNDVIRQNKLLIITIIPTPIYVCLNFIKIFYYYYFFNFIIVLFLSDWLILVA